MPWLLDEDTLETLRAYDPASVADQQVDYEARLNGENEGGSRLLARAGNTASITIAGVLTNRPSFFARFYGGGNTTYSEIISAIAEAEADPEVAKIDYEINSPGGQLEGLFEAIEAAKAGAKPSRTVVRGQMASAAYMFGVQADSVVAVNRASVVGSVGVMATLRKRGDTVIVTSTNAPEKNPDPETPEGQAIIRKYLDGLERIFVDAIAEGRNTTVSKVNADFGRGSPLVAEEALSKGMIDSIGGTSRKTQSKIPKSATSAAKPNMDIEKLKAEHPALYAQIFGLGVAKGQTDERDRVSAHLTLGDASGDMKTALKAVEDGTEMTAGLSAKYQAAAMKKKVLDAKGGDDTDISGGGGGDDPEQDDGDKLLAACGASDMEGVI